MNRILPLATTLLLLAACGRGSTERDAARRAVHRDWCVAEELAIEANEQISKLDTLRAGAEGAGPIDQIYPFARARYDFAKARERQLALLDSAALASSSADSAEFAGRAAQAAPPAPADGVAANAARDYQRDFALALGNPAHPCNRPPDSEQ